MQQIGPYRVEGEIGKGGMATVYRVTNPKGEVYALKLLHQGPKQDKRWGTRFRREFRLLSRLRHKHLIEVHDYGEDEFQAYYVMDYIDGTNLWKFYRQELRGKSSDERLSWLIPLVSQIVSALDYIHHHNVIHKDLKPANILLQHNGESAYLADFGLARELTDNAMYTSPGFMGTLGYSAPEIIDRGRLDGRADLYSLGVILYTLLADRRPIQVEGRSFDQLLRAIRTEEPIPIGRLLPDLPAQVAHLIHQCIQKDPAKRYRNTREMWQDLLPLIERYRPQQAPAPEATMRNHPSMAATMVSEPAVSPPVSLPTTGGLLVESELIGREQELALCQNALSGFRQQSKALLFYGIPGIGKSFFLEEVQRQCQRHGMPHVMLRLPSNPPPYGSLTEWARQWLPSLSPSILESTNAQLLAQYLPGLADLLPTPTLAAGPLTHPIVQLTDLLVPLVLQLPPHAPLVWLIDDLQNADPTSKDILARIFFSLLSQPQFHFLLIASVGYQTDSRGAPFPMADHPRVEHQYLLPLTEEEESQYVGRLLGQAPDPKQLKQIRDFTRGLPLRTLEFLHQGTLLSQDLHSVVEEVTSADVLSSAVSTALHDLSSIQEALRQTRAEPHEAPAKTPLFREESQGYQRVPTDPELSPFEAFQSAEAELPEDDDDTGNTIDNQDAAFVPKAKSPGTVPMNAFNPEKTIMMAQPLLPSGSHTLEHPAVLHEAAAEQTRVQELPPVLNLLHDFVAEGETEEDSGPKGPQQPSSQGQQDGGLIPMSAAPEPNSTFVMSRPPAGAMASQDLLSTPLVPMDAPPARDEASSQEDLRRFAESSEELVLVPLLQRRLDLLEAPQRLRFCVTAFLPERFTYEQLQHAIQSSPEEALDLLNVLLSIRLLKAELQGEEEQYGHLHPVMKRMLKAEIPEARQAEFALRAANAMVASGSDYQLQSNASFLARRFTEGGDPVNAVRWQINTATQAFHARLIGQLKDNLQDLQVMLIEWVERGAAFQLLQALPDLLDLEEGATSLLHQTGYQLLLVGILHHFDAKDLRQQQSKKARGLLRQLLNSLPSPSSPEFQATIRHLQPLLIFARLRLRKKK